MKTKLMLFAMAFTVTGCVSTKRFEKDMLELQSVFYLNQAVQTSALLGKIEKLEKWSKDHQSISVSTRSKPCEDWDLGWTPQGIKYKNSITTQAIVDPNIEYPSFDHIFK